MEHGEGYKGTKEWRCVTGRLKGACVKGMRGGGGLPGGPSSGLTIPNVVRRRAQGGGSVVSAYCATKDGDTLGGISHKRM